MQPQYNNYERQPNAFLDVLHIYRARIVNKPDPGDDRLQIRVMPHMADVQETDLLPYYPPFFAGQVIVGKNENLDGAPSAALVWVAALPDFSMGFVMGLANDYESTGAAAKFTKSYNYKAVVQGLAGRGLLPSYIDYRNLYVQYWTDNYLEMVDFRHGDKYIIQSNGNMIIMSMARIYMQVGSGAAADSSVNPNGSAPAYSSISLSRESIDMVTPILNIKAGQIKMGNQGLNLVGATATVPIFVEGITLQPQTHITF